MIQSTLLDNIQEAIKENCPNEIATSANPMPFLKDRRYVIPVGNGLFVLKGVLVELMNVIDKSFARLASGLGAEPVYVPSLLGEENTKNSRYLESFSHQALRLRQPNSDPDHFASSGLACPTVCYHIFSAYGNSQINSGQCLTAVSRCARHETGNLDDLSRLMNFTMREIVVLDSAKGCEAKFSAIYQAVKELLIDKFKLSFHVQTASDPFFGKEQTLRKKAQLLNESKLEVRAHLPFSGETVGIASFNRHQNVFYERFDIRANGLDSAESICVGFGYERILFAILSQKGTSFTDAYYQKILSED